MARKLVRNLALILLGTVVLCRAARLAGEREALAAFCAAREGASVPRLASRTTLEGAVMEENGRPGLENLGEWRGGRLSTLTGTRATGGALAALSENRGRRVRVTARWRCRYPLRNPSGETDGGLFSPAIQVVAGGPVGIEKVTEDGGILARAQALALDWLERPFRGAPVTLGMLRAVWTGDAAGVPPAVTRAYRALGLSHVVALSGQHVAGLGLWISLLLYATSASLAVRGRFGEKIFGALALHGRRLVPAVSVGVLLLTSGGSPSVLRTAAMVASSWALRYRGWRSVPLQVLGSSAALLLLWDPSLVASPGFFLSAGATACLVHALENPGWGALKAYAIIAIAMPLLMWPMGAFFFGRLPIAAPLAGILVVWAWDLGIVPAGFLLPLVIRALPEAARVSGLERIDEGLAWLEQWHAAALPVVERTSLVCPRPTLLEMICLELLLVWGAIALRERFADSTSHAL